MDFPTSDADFRPFINRDIRLISKKSVTYDQKSFFAHFHILLKMGTEIYVFNISDISHLMKFWCHFKAKGVVFKTRHNTHFSEISDM